MEELGFELSLSPTLPIASMPILNTKTVSPGAGLAVGLGLALVVGEGLALPVGEGLAVGEEVALPVGLGLVLVVGEGFALAVGEGLAATQILFAEQVDPMQVGLQATASLVR